LICIELILKNNLAMKTIQIILENNSFMCDSCSNWPKSHLVMKA